MLNGNVSYSGHKQGASSKLYNPASRKSNHPFYTLKDQFIYRRGTSAKRSSITSIQSFHIDQTDPVVTLKHPFYLNSPPPPALIPFPIILSQLVVTVSHVQPTPSHPLILHAFSLTLLPKNLHPPPPPYFSSKTAIQSFRRLLEKLLNLWVQEGAQSVVGLSSAARAVMCPWRGLHHYHKEICTPF
jgi:hypothetical protein